MGTVSSRLRIASANPSSSQPPQSKPAESPKVMVDLKKARAGEDQSGSGDQGLFLPWTCFVNVVPFLNEVKTLRLVSKAHRQAIDGYLLFDQGKVPLYPPLGFKTKKYLKTYDMYVLTTYGEEAWRAGWNESHSREFIKLSRQVRKDLQRVCDAMNKRNMVDIDLDQLPRVPGDFSPDKPRHLTAIDVYVLRKYGTKFWAEKNASHQIYFGRLEDEYHHLCQRAKYHLQHEARALNQRYAINEFTAPVLPSDFSPGRHVDNFDVFVIRKYGCDKWLASGSAFTHATSHREEFRRLSSSIRESLREEAKAINRRLPATPMPPPLPPNFKTEKQVGALDVYFIRKMGEQAWRSRHHNWAAERSEYCLLSDADRFALKKEADELNRRIELTARDLAGIHGITNDGAVYVLDPSKRSKRWSAS